MAAILELLINAKKTTQNLFIKLVDPKTEKGTSKTLTPVY